MRSTPRSTARSPAASISTASGSAATRARPGARSPARAADASPESLRFAFASCAHYEQGFFSAYRHMAEDRPDLILMLGDYIYEDAWGDRRVRQFDPLEAVTLEDYRRRYTQYRTDPDLQAAHAACPWLVTWDDHEVDNDYVGLTSEHELCGGAAVREAFPARRAAAYQAWYEHMPVRPSRLDPAMAIRIYGATDWGRLARFHVLDTRQYRSVQVCPAAADRERCDFAKGRKILFGGAGGANFIDPNEAPARRRSRTSHAPCSARRRNAGSTARSRKARRLEPARAERDDDDRGRGHGGIAAPLQRRLGRLSARARAAVRRAREAPHGEPGRADRRHPFLLGQRPRERRRPAGRRRARHLLDRDQHLRQVARSCRSIPARSSTTACTTATCAASSRPSASRRHRHDRGSRGSAQRREVSRPPSRSRPAIPHAHRIDAG